ncbi:MAG: hypothetical protein JO157_18075 [Acetobacteraceae bacterium]|nr:hypothetical protein [Acetobacteraceae bacterium]
MEAPEGPLPPARHEVRDVGFRPLLIAGILTLMALAGVIGLAAWLFPQSLQDQMVPQAQERFPAPELQPSPPADMAAFHAQQLRQLNGTYWLDAGKTRLHIPIGQAMQDVARDGIADWPTK